MSDSPESTAVEYRDVPGFPSYRVGDDGSVWSSKWGRWRRLAARPNHQGRHRVVLLRDLRPYDRYVARLVLETFVGPSPFSGAEALHGDDDKSNNHLGNLRWGTQAENVADAHANGRIRKRATHYAAKLTDADVAEIIRLRAEGMKVVEIGARFNVTHQHVCKLCQGKRWRDGVETR